MGVEERAGLGGEGRICLLIKPPTWLRLPNIVFKIKFLAKLRAVKLRFRNWEEIETQVGHIHLFPGLHQFEFSIKGMKSLRT